QRGLDSSVLAIRLMIERRPLEPAVRALLEAFFDADLGAMRLIPGVLGTGVTTVAGASGLTLGEWVFLAPSCAAPTWLRHPAGIELLAHEAVHVLQFRERGMVPFLTGYVGMYARARFTGKRHHSAYVQLTEERVAFAVQARIRSLMHAVPTLPEVIAGGGVLDAGLLARVSAARGRLGRDGWSRL
ncbi:MAG: DUF4157 domain-containing protein, partial [Acidobacteriota bacterium]